MHKLILLLLITASLAADKFAVVTVSIGSAYSSATRPGVLSKKAYCKRHGYDFFCFRKFYDRSRSHAWQKIKAVEQVLQDYDWVFWSDADSLIMNQTICLESFIDENASFIIAFDHFSNVVNSGQFLIKNSEKSALFLKKVYDKVDCINHIWWENAAIIKILEEEEFKTGFVKILPQRDMNSFAPEVCPPHSKSCYQNGDFIIHFPSVRNLSQLRRLMSKYHALISSP